MNFCRDGVSVSSYADIKSLMDDLKVEKDDIREFSSDCDYKYVLIWILSDYSKDDLMSIISNSYIHGSEIEATSNIYWIEDTKNYAFVYGDYSI
ncbi:MAG: hypothetical protein ACRCX2_22030 [Paraclostridium sp.]